MPSLLFSNSREVVIGNSSGNVEDVSGSSQRNSPSIDARSILDEDPLTVLDTTEFAAEAGDQILDEQLQRGTHEHVFDGVYPSELAYPYSVYEEFKPPLLKVTEKAALAQFLPEMTRTNANSNSNSSSSTSDFVEIELTDFSIYMPGDSTRHAWRLCGLQNLWAKIANSRHVFDGVISYEGQSYWVERVPFSICSIGNYGIESDHVDGQIWLQTAYNEYRKTDIFYRLKTPSPPYKRYFDNFLWLANLSKYFIDFMDTKLVSIHDFRSNFETWLRGLHGNSDNYRQWYQQHTGADFRCAISANINFLYKEAMGVDTAHEKHVIWSEVKHLDHIPEQKMKEEKTIVTPYVYDCFAHLKSGKWLKAVSPAEEVVQRRESLADTLHLCRQRTQTAQDGDKRPCFGTAQAEIAKAGEHQMSIDRGLDNAGLSVGDTVAVIKDDATISLWKEEKSQWRQASDSELWYVYIQVIHGQELGKRSFDVIWLYKPSDTTCAIMKYPWNNEIFFSDHCNCHDRKRIKENEIQFKVRIAWNKITDAGDRDYDFFIRTTYLQETSSYITFDSEHKTCIHKRDDVKTPLQELVDSTSIGDTVLVVPPRSFRSEFGLEPAEVVDFIQEGRHGFVQLRRLPRCHTLKTKIGYVRPPPRPNELVYSDEEFRLESGAISTPYDRDGTGDCYYITSILKDGYVQPVSRENAPKFRQGFSPATPHPHQCPKLRGMDLYCGGGTYGRGLEEGGAIENVWAVDLNKNALHTYHANTNKEVKLFLGSVDDLLAQALAGNPKNSTLIPGPGEVDFISAGSPCTGFSLLNQNKDDMKGLKNQSLVASVAAYIDFYRPKYALLENVITMASKKANRDQDMLSQLICAFVGMGYQLELFVLDAWTFGSAQSRSRLFVSISAPGLPVPQHPGLTHSHPERTPNRGLGNCANGAPFGKRRFELTPFEFRTASEATDDLPDIGDGRTGCCVSHPDHRTPWDMTDQLRTQIGLIPVHPFGMNLVKASKLFSKLDEEVFPSRYTRSGKLTQGWLGSSKAYERIHPGKLFQTVTTSLKVRDRDSGKSLHWSQHRTMTVMEARRAQSYPDHEVITGSTQAQWRIIGNSVARTVALALGMSIRTAWLKIDPVKFRMQPLSLPKHNEYGSRLAGLGLKPVQLQTPPPSNAPTFTIASSTSAASSVTTKRRNDEDKDEEDTTTQKKRKLKDCRMSSALSIHTDVNRIDRVEMSSSASTSKMATSISSPVVTNDQLPNVVNDHATPKATVLNQKLQAFRDGQLEAEKTAGSGPMRSHRTNLQRFVAPANPADGSPSIHKIAVPPSKAVPNLITGQNVPRIRQGVVGILAPQRLQMSTIKSEVIVLSDTDDESLDELVVEPSMLHATARQRGDTIDSTRRGTPEAEDDVPEVLMVNNNGNAHRRSIVRANLANTINARESGMTGVNSSPGSARGKIGRSRII